MNARGMMQFPKEHGNPAWVISPFLMRRRYLPSKYPHKGTCMLNSGTRSRERGGAEGGTWFRAGEEEMETHKKGVNVV
jgi:hypothetical protein